MTSTAAVELSPNREDSIVFSCNFHISNIQPWVPRRGVILMHLTSNSNINSALATMTGETPDVRSNKMKPRERKTREKREIARKKERKERKRERKREEER